MSRQSKSTQLCKLTIPAGGTGRQKVTGRFLYVVSCPVKVKLRLDGQPLIDAFTGTSLEVQEGGDFIEWFEIVNPTVEDIEVTVYVGFVRFQENAFTIVEGPKETLGSGVISIPATNEVVFDGIRTGFQLHRQALQVFNADPNNNVQIFDEDDEMIAIVFPETGVKIEGANYMSVYNPNGSPVSVAMSEIWAIRPQ